MARRKRLFIRVFFVIGLSGAFLCYGLLSSSQSPRRIEEKIEIGTDVDSSGSILLSCCECSPSQCETAGSFITLPYESDVWAKVISSQAGTPITFGLESPYHEHYWDDARQHVGDDTLVGYFTQGTQLLFHIHPWNPCSAYTNNPRISGSAPVWTLEFEDWTDCDWNDLVVEVRLCNFESDTSDTIKIDLNVQGGDSARVEPGDSLNLVVAVTDSLCNSVDSFMIDFAVLPVFYSGGHTHDFNTPNGRADPDTGLTDQNGRVTTTFWPRVDTCGQPSDRDNCSASLLRGIAGKYKVWAISRDDTTLWDSLHIQSRISDSLEQLEEGEHWNLIGGTTAHPSPSNHYGTLASNEHLRDIGCEFDSTLVARGQLVPQGGLVEYNDQSLEWGGMFDIGPTQEHPEWRLWHCPHCGHHHGRSCDIDKLGRIDRDTILGRIIEEHGDTIGYYRYLWHVDFPN